MKPWIWGSCNGGKDSGRRELGKKQPLNARVGAQVSAEWALVCSELLRTNKNHVEDGSGQKCRRFECFTFSKLQNVQKIRLEWQKACIDDQRAPGSTLISKISIQKVKEGTSDPTGI